MNARLLFTHTLSPLHAGTGQGVGVIDLPIAREKATGIPYLPGSSLKGTLRDLCKHARKEEVYGPATNNADESAGAAQFADQRLLLLPVRSLAGTFAWVTSPYLLKRFLRDAKDAGVAQVANLTSPKVDGEKCFVVNQELVNGQTVGCKLKLKVGTTDKVVLEDLDLAITEDAQTKAWAVLIGRYVFAGDAEWQRMLVERFCVVSDDVLSFLLDTATEITARIKLLEDVKTVQQGGLWYEEALPTETILYGFVLATLTEYHKKKGLDETILFDVVGNSIEPVVQLGGKATVGRGLCRLSFQGSQKQLIQIPPSSNQQQSAGKKETETASSSTAKQGAPVEPVNNIEPSASTPVASSKNETVAPQPPSPQSPTWKVFAAKPMIRKSST